MQIDTRKLKKLIIKAIPYVAFSYVGNLIGFAYRTAEGNGFQEKLLPFMSNLGVAFARIFPSLHPFDLLFGLVLAGVMRLILYVKSKNRKKFRQGEEYGSAVWGTQKDIEPYMDLSCPENNVILTKTESLTMGKPSAPKFARNENIPPTHCVLSLYEKSFMESMKATVRSDHIIRLNVSSLIARKQARAMITSRI